MFIQLEQIAAKAKKDRTLRFHVVGAFADTSVSHRDLLVLLQRKEGGWLQPHCFRSDPSNEKLAGGLEDADEESGPAWVVDSTVYGTAP